ncbi:hypothetical protein DLO46_10280 [Salmonella enterica]|nr:hypothetical protein [Salmonella enterica]ELI4816390.1 hypothetical protein [Salmonella enterica]
MTEPRIEKLFDCDSWRDKKFRRADVAEEVVKYFGDDFVDSAYYIRAGRILKEGIERGVIKKIQELRAQGVTGRIDFTLPDWYQDGIQLRMGESQCAA